MATNIGLLYKVTFVYLWMISFTSVGVKLFETILLKVNAVLCLRLARRGYEVYQKLQVKLIFCIPIYFGHDNLGMFYIEPKIGLSGLYAVSTINGVSSLLSFFLSVSFCYFSPRRGYRRVLKFCMGF
jgi:hypothetical protein